MSQKSFTVDSGLTILNGNIVATTANNPGSINWAGNSSGDGYGYTTMRLVPDDTVGGDSYLIIDPTAPNHIHIRAGGAQDNSGSQLFLGGENSYFLVENGANSNVYVASNSNQWKFDTTGILTLPGEGVLQSLNDTVTLSSLNTTTGNANSVYLGSSGGLGFNDQAIGGNWLEIFRSGSDPEIRVPTGGGNILITGASGSGGAAGRDITITAGPADQTNYYTTAGGAVNIVGGLGATDDGGGGGPGGNVNITAGVSADPAGVAGNVNITAGSNDWVFDNTGNLTVPGNVSATGNVTGGNLITTGSGGDITMSGGDITGAGNISLDGGYINGGTATVVTDGINSIALAPGATMDVFGFPFAAGAARGQLTITGITTPSEANGTWYYQSVNNTYTYQIYTDSTYSTLVDASGWSAYTGGGEVAITLQDPRANIVVNSNGYLSTFDNTGNLTVPGSITAQNFVGNGSQLTGVAGKTTGTWTVTTGTNDYSFTVEANNTYQLWVNGNIPNGIIVYNATVSVSNTNVPVIGQQFAWNYEGAGNPITFTSIPAQIIGTANAISNANPSVGTTTNTFTFGINNSSGNTVTVNYGYTKIS